MTSLDVFFYEGYQGEETPREIRIGRTTHRIADVLERRREQKEKSGVIIKVFVCRLSNGDEVEVIVKPGRRYEIRFL